MGSHDDVCSHAAWLARYGPAASNAIPRLEVPECSGELFGPKAAYALEWCRPDMRTWRCGPCSANSGRIGPGRDTLPISSIRLGPAAKEAIPLAWN